MLTVTYEPFIMSVIMKNVIMLGLGCQGHGLTLHMFISVKMLPRDKQSSLYLPEASVTFMVTVTHAECHI
jgi:hypothetical protein